MSAGCGVVRVRKARGRLVVVGEKEGGDVSKRKRNSFFLLARYDYARLLVICYLPVTSYLMILEGP